MVGVEEESGDGVKPWHGSVQWRRREGCHEHKPSFGGTLS